MKYGQRKRQDSICFDTPPGPPSPALEAIAPADMNDANRVYSRCTPAPRLQIYCGDQLSVSECLTLGGESCPVILWPRSGPQLKGGGAIKLNYTSAHTLATRRIPTNSNRRNTFRFRTNTGGGAGLANLSECARVNGVDGAALSRN